MAKHPNDTEAATPPGLRLAGTIRFLLSQANKWLGIQTFQARVEVDSTLRLVDQAADPSANGDFQLNGADVKVYSGGAARNLSDAHTQETLFIWAQPHTQSETGVLDTAISRHGAASIGDASSAGRIRLSIPIPTGYNTLTKAVVIVISAETGDLRWEVSTVWGADGEQVGANSDSISTTTRGMTANQIDEIDVTAALTGLAAGDRLGFQFNRAGSDGADTIATLFVLGLLLEFTQ